jgi:hypothetical protein
MMLFDRLVFPVPDSPQGALESPGRTEWVKDPVEWARWKEAGWKPRRQARVLEILDPVVRRLPWDRGRRDEWKAESATLATQEMYDYSFVATRNVLTRDLPHHVRGVAAMGPAYRSYRDFRREFPALVGDPRTRGTRAAPRLPAGVLTAVLGWAFLTPVDDDVPVEDLLRETVAFVTGSSDFKRRRAAFNEWQQKFVRDGFTDGEAIAAAVEDMADLLEDLRKAAKKHPVRTVVQYCFRLAPALLSAGAAAVHFPSEMAVALGEGFVSVGELALEGWFARETAKPWLAPAAFVHDARRHFGWR